MESIVSSWKKARISRFTSPTARFLLPCARPVPRPVPGIFFGLFSSIVIVSVSMGLGERYCVSCDQNSFEVLTADEPEPYETDSGYEYALQNEFTGCPEGCRLYQPKWQAPLNRLRTSFHPVHWLERQPWQVKVALIAVPLLVVAAYFGVLRDLATLVRAIGEVWRGK